MPKTTTTTRTRKLKIPLAWPGGKRRLAPAILAHVDSHQAYAETCCGGAAVFWAKPKAVSAAEILNDADGELINFYYELHAHGRRLIAEVDAMPYSRRLFERTRASKPRSPFRRAVRFWYLNRVAFGAKRSGAAFGVNASRRAWVLPPSILVDLDATIERLRGVCFESLDLTRFIELYDRPSTLFYVDPPYYGVSQPYACTFGQTDHQRLAAALATVRGRVLLSYNDCPAVRALYPRWQAVELTTRYTMGCNSPTGGNADASELLLINRRSRSKK